MAARHSTLNYGRGPKPLSYWAGGSVGIRSRPSRNCRLSWAARGLLIYLLSKPDNLVSIQELVKATEGAGDCRSDRDAVRRDTEGAA